ELVGVAKPLVRNELDIFAAERVAIAGREVAEGHLERAADLGLEMMHRAGKAVGRQPFRECVRLEERAIDLLGPGREDAVQANGVGHDVFLVLNWLKRAPPVNRRPGSAEPAWPPRLP